MDNVTISPVAEWSTAITNLDLERVKTLLDTTPDLLWESVTIPENEDHAYLVDQLERCQLLGNDLTNLAAIPYLLLDFDDEPPQLQKRGRLFEFLLSRATPEELDTRSWGSCGDKTMHLAAFMGHGQQELVARGASITVPNDLGHLPPKTPRFVKKHSNNRIRKQIEKSMGGSQEELLKHKTQRKQDIDLLAKRSAVKNNPLFKKFENQHQQQPISPSSSEAPLNRTLGVPYIDKVDLIRKNSKVINSLKTKSYVTSSVFRQNAATTATVASQSSPTPAPRKMNTVPAAEDTKKAAEPLDPANKSSDISTPTAKEASAAAKRKEEEPVTVVVTQIDLPTKEEPKEIKTSSPVESEAKMCVEKPLEKEVIMPRSSLAVVTAKDVLNRPDSPTLELESHLQLMASHKQNESPRQGVDSSPPGIEPPQPVITETEKPAPTQQEIDGISQQQNNDYQDPIDLVEPTSPQQAALKEMTPTESSPHFTHAALVNNIPQSIPITSVNRISTPCTEEEKDNYTEDNTLSANETDIEEIMMSIESQPLERESPLTLATTDKYHKNKMDFDQWYDSYDEWSDGLYEPPSLPPQPSHSKRQSTLKEDLDESSIASGTPPASFSPQQRLSMSAESVDTLPPPCVKDDDVTVTTVMPPATPIRGGDYGSISVQPTSYYLNDTHAEEAPSVLSDSLSLHHSAKDMVSDEDSAYSYMEMKVELDTRPNPEPSVASTESNDLQSINLDFQEMPPIKLDDRFVQESMGPMTYDDRDMRNQQHYDSVGYQSTGKYESQQQQYSEDHEPVFHQYYNYNDEYRPPSDKLELPEVVNHPGQSTSAFGKLYVRVSSAENILLPLPDQSAFVRVVVSDGEYEFMSRYEELGPKVLFDYECIIDARPDMIVTLAVHVRPDPHVKPKTGLTRWFAPTYYKQREMLAGYVHPEDGAIGQSRFALGHMIQACNQKVYGTSFDCFNSWYARTSRERHREQMGHEDILKVVASLSIEMLYLPVTDPSLPVPKNLRECDLALRIRQWHDTCWHNGFLLIRQENSKIWDRHYCRLIGSQLLGYVSKTASSWKPRVQYDIADALQLAASSDKVVMALVDDYEETHKLVFQSDTIIQETNRGYFRITFADTYIDCACDDLQENEAWVKILRSMIGRVPLRMRLSV